LSSVPSKIADDVAEIASSVQRPVFDQIGRATRVHDDGDAELGGFGPEHVVLREREILAVDMTADRRPAKPETRDAILELFRCQFWMLQRHRRQRHEPVGVGGHPLRESLVLRPHDRGRELTVRGVPPEAVDRERLHVDALLIHDPESFRAEHVAAAATAHLGKW
jgi:hypothetical protein